MKRRRLVIEWNDQVQDTDEECLKAFVEGEWDIHDLKKLDEDISDEDRPKLAIWVQDAISPGEGLAPVFRTLIHAIERVDELNDEEKEAVARVWGVITLLERREK